MAVERGDGRDTTGKSLRQGRGAATGWVAVLVLCACGVWGAVRGAPLARKSQGGVPPAAHVAPAAPDDGAAAGAPGQPPEASASWQVQARQQIAAAEYEVTWQKQTALASVPAAWQAPNRAHDFRTYFTPGAIRVVPRMAQEKDWEWSLTLAGYGRGDSVWPVVQGTPSPTGNRVDYTGGGLDEWYVNSPQGLEQGFVLPAPPEKVAAWSAQTLLAQRLLPSPGRGHDIDPAQLIHLDLELAGGLMPVISTDGQAIDFQIPGGARVVHYGQLQVTGADGTLLPAWMEGFAGAGRGGIRLVLDARQAVYPITVDPLATSAAWTAESNQIGAFFGDAVSTAGDVNGDGYSDVLVGVPFYDNGQFYAAGGRVYLFLGSAAGLGATPAWLADGVQSGARFGISVSTAGDVNGDGYADVIIGSDTYDNGQNNEGSAYLYLGAPGGLGTTAAWSAESNQAEAHFGQSVSTAGDVNGDGYSDVIVGAPYYDNTEMEEGRAFVYVGSPSGLSATPAWTAESDQTSAEFGYSVSTAGDVNGDGYSDVIIGAYLYDNGQNNEGGAFVYMGSAGGLSGRPHAGPLDSAWTGEGDQADALFGYSVSAAGDVNGDGYADVIVGARWYDNVEANEGRAFVYLGSPTGLVTMAAWTAESNQALAMFGYSVSTAGDVNGDGYADVIVGAGWYTNVEMYEGRAFVYLGSSTGLATTAAWTAESNQIAAIFGYSVSTAGDVNGDGFADVIAGARAYDNGQSNEGRAYLYMGSAAGPVDTAVWTGEGDQARAYFGVSVSTAGDVNGDGYADVLIGAYGYDNGQADEGRAYLYLGSAAGLGTAPAWTAESDQAGSRFGISVSTAGDVNGDGYADVIVGASFFHNGQTAEGRAYLYLGSAAGLAAGSIWTAESNQAYGQLGSSVSAAGDVNGDGFGDVIVGIISYKASALVYLGSPAGLGSMAASILKSDGVGDQFGLSVSAAGDVNGDGFGDVIVGAPGYSNGQSNEGRAFVYLGSATGLLTVAAWTSESNQYFARFGSSVSTAGDVNGDGYADVIVGAPLYDNSETDEGRAYVYLGSAAGLGTTPGWTAESNQASALLGNSVSTAGDVNGDGYADIIVGVLQYDNGEIDEGAAFVYLGSSAGVGTTPAWSAESNQAGANAGGAVSLAGDINGDGYADILVGARNYDNLQTNQGRAYLYLGNAGAGLSLALQQRRSDDTAPIADTGWSRTTGSFRLKAQGRSPFGRGRVKAEYEVKSFGQPFDGTSTLTSPSWSDTGTALASFNKLLTGLPPDAYHWRMRLLYDPATTPFQNFSRWFTVPWNGAAEMDLRASPFIGGTVWNDLNADGIHGWLEPGVGSVAVQLLDASSMLVSSTMTDATGAYRFEIHSLAVPYRLGFVLSSGSVFTLSNQGVDDAVDSDADPATGQTALISAPIQVADAGGWSAGLRPVGACTLPTQSVFISNVHLLGTGAVLDLLDGNPPGNVTGYDIHRSSDRTLAPALWPLVALDTADMNSSTPGIQLTDGHDDSSPTGIWFYDVTAYNHFCAAEGPR